MCTIAQTVTDFSGYDLIEICVKINTIFSGLNGHLLVRLRLKDPYIVMLY